MIGRDGDIVCIAFIGGDRRDDNGVRQQSQSLQVRSLWRLWQVMEERRGETLSYTVKKTSSIYTGLFGS